MSATTDNVPKLVLTDQGADMIARSVAQEKLYITGIAMGAGQLANVGGIPGLTGLVSEKARVSIVKQVRSGRQLRVSGPVSIPSTTQAFKWREVGIFGQIGSETDKLMGYYYLGESGETVSPADGVERSIYVTVEIDPAANVEVVLAPRETIAWEDVTDKPQTYAPAAHTHTADEAEAVPTTRKVNGKALSSDITLEASDVGAAAEDHGHSLESIGAAAASHGHPWSQLSDIPGNVSRASNPNLLVNWDFADPINRRGKSVYTSMVGYTIDCWKIWQVNNPENNQSLQVADGGIVLDASGTGNASIVFEQYFEKPINGTYTVSVLVDEISGQLLVEEASLVITQPGLFAATFTATAAASLIMYNLGAEFHCKIRAVKLELGDTQTLAHQDADGNWVLNDPPPNKALELAKCQRYFQRYEKDEGVCGFYWRTSTGSFALFIPTPVTMRTNPAVSISGYLDFMDVSGNHEESNGITYSGTGILSENGVTVYGVPISGLSDGMQFGMFAPLIEGPGVIELNSEP